MKIVIFGAGNVGKEAFKYFQKKGDEVVYFIDNAPRLWGTTIYDIEVIGLDKYVKDKMNYLIAIAMPYKDAKSVERQLRGGGYSNYIIYESDDLCAYGGRLVSYSDPRDKEDVILWHLLKDEREIYYIDIGSNDPLRGNVTKLFYDIKNAHGINVEPKKVLADFTKMERPRDITLQLGVGEEEGEMILYFQGGGSTFLKENSILEKGQQDSVKITTLRKICEEYVPEGQHISFLKIDVEGAEEQTLLGADFDKYRPEIICIEATIPRTDIPCHEKWEYILTRNNYEYAFTYGINRYYIAREYDEKYKETVKEIPNIEKIYNIYRAGVSLLV